MAVCLSIPICICLGMYEKSRGQILMTYGPFHTQITSVHSETPMPLPNVQAVREDKNPADHFDSGAKWTYCVNLTHQVYWWTYHVPCGPPMNLLPPSYYLPRASCGSPSLECPVAVPPSDHSRQLFW